MRQREDLDIQPYSYTVEDEKLARQILELLEELKPYPNLELLRELFVTGVKLAQDNCARGDLKIIRTAIKEMRYAFRVFLHYRGIPKVSIFGSARCVPGDPEFETAVEFGKRMAEAGYMVITGAGGGVMAAGHLGAGRERSFGLNITLPFEQLANETITKDKKLINFRYFFTRKLFFVKESDAIVLMPGGFGTLDEGFEALTLIQTGKNDPTPVVMLDRPGGTYWRQWYQFIQGAMMERGFISPEDKSLFYITDSVEDACAEIRRFYRRYHSSRYVNNRQKLLLRLKEPAPEALVAKLNETFHDILVKGTIESVSPFPEESDEPDSWELPRLALAFDQRHFGRLRELINMINSY
ncbi:MAG: TIGR00730 family Rossman fold protein [Acidobacteria bacterium]|nr:TIGR00730 family Rossman fold protein [Acidobacteriota bacterium]